MSMCHKIATELDKNNCLEPDSKRKREGINSLPVFGPCRLSNAGNYLNATSA